MEAWKIKDELKPKKLKNISDTQIEYHFETHYKGYVKKLNEIWEKLVNSDKSTANQNYSEYRELKSEESFNYDGALLHELYFEGLSEQTDIPEEVKKEIENSFGSYEKWVEDFKAQGTAFRGWSLLVFDLNSGKLRNVGTDSHNSNAMWNTIVIIAMDTYEHAYYTDYGPKRAQYIDAFLAAVNWKKVSKRLQKAKNAYSAMKDN